MVASAAVSAVGSVVGGVAQASGAQSAAGAQEQSAQDATNAQMQMFDTTQQNLQPYDQFGQGQFANYNNALGNYTPYTTAGANAANEITGLEGGSGTGVPNAQTMQNTLQALPGYQFALNQGLESTQNGFAARGLGSSGAALKGAATYATGLANQDYNNLLTGLQNTANTGLGAASGLSGTIQNAINTGGNAAAGVGNAAVSTGQSIGQNTVGAGNAAAASDISTGNAIGNAASGLGTSALLYNNQGGLYGPYGVFTPPQQFPAPITYDP